MSDSKQTKVPNWFQVAIAKGIHAMQTLGLEGEPAAELMPGLLKTWIADLWDDKAWDRDAHVEVIAETFAELRRTMTRWPGMFHFNQAWTLAAGNHRREEREGTIKSVTALLSFEPTNQSAVAVANCRACCAMMQLKVPHWAREREGAEEETIQAEFKKIRAQFRADKRERKREEGKKGVEA